MRRLSERVRLPEVVEAGGKVGEREKRKHVTVNLQREETKLETASRDCVSGLRKEKK